MRAQRGTSQARQTYILGVEQYLLDNGGPTLQKVVSGRYVKVNLKDKIRSVFICHTVSISKLGSVMSRYCSFKSMPIAFVQLIFLQFTPCFL